MKAAIITIGERTLITILTLFFCGYALLVLAACAICEGCDRQIKQDYPLTKPPRRP